MNVPDSNLPQSIFLTDRTLGCLAVGFVLKDMFGVALKARRLVILAFVLVFRVVHLVK